MGDAKSRMATYKAFQELAEALLDLCAMACKDEDKNVKDDYANIETLKSLKIIDEKTAKALAEINGLRNRVVHEYNGIKYDIFSSSAARLLADAEKFLESVKTWMQRNSRK